MAHASDDPIPVRAGGEHLADGLFGRLLVRRTVAFMPDNRHAELVSASIRSSLTLREWILTCVRTTAKERLSGFGGAAWKAG